MVSSVVIVNVGKIFCKACYILEGDSNLIFRANVILSNFELFVGVSVEEFTLPFDHKLDNNIKRRFIFLANIKIDLMWKLMKLNNYSKKKKITKVQLLIEESKLHKKILEDGGKIKNSPSINKNIESNMGQRRSGRTNVNLDYRSISGIRSRNNNTNNNNTTNPFDYIQQQLMSIKSEWGDLKTLRDDAQKQVTAKERELKNCNWKDQRGD